MKGAADELNAGGYCGPDDRGAYFQCVLCLAWPDAEMRMFEGRAEGQFVWPWSVTRHGRLILDLETCFVPESESIALSCLDGERRRKYSDEQRAFAAVGRGLSI